MLAVSNAFSESFKQNDREVKMRIKVNDVAYTDSDIISFNYNAGSIVGESFAIGSTYANSIKLTLCKIVEGLKQLDEVIPEMGIVLPNGSTEWVKLGTFIISEEVNPDRNENRTSLECTDKMIMLDDIYESKLKYPAKIRDVALEIANLAGVEVDKVSFGRLMENAIQKPIGYTFRQAIGLIAQFEAGYACFDRNGLLAIRQLEDKDYQVTPNEYFQNGLTKNELKFRPAGIQVKVSDNSEDDKVIKIGNEKGSVIRLENKVMTEQLLRLVYEKVKDINYYPFTLKWRGNPAVEVGDWLQVDDTRGNVFKVPNLSYSMEYKGGLTATSTVETVASNEVRFGYKKILDQVVELVENSIKDIDGNVIYYGVEEPPNPKEGDTWFKYVDSDTEIWVYEKVNEPDVFDWVFKISSAVDETIKEKIEQLEEESKQQQLDIEEALSESALARKEAFDSTVISRQAERDALNALAQGDKNKTEITKLDDQQKLTNTKVEGNTANILSLQSDSERLSLSLGKVQSDVENINVGSKNVLDSTKEMVQLSQHSEIDTVEFIEGFKVLKTKITGPSDYRDTYRKRTTSSLKGNEYIVSFWAKANTTFNMRCYFYSPNTTISAESSTGQKSTSVDGGVIVTVTDEWKKYWVKWKQTPTTGMKEVIIGRIFNDNADKMLYLTQMKLEEGNLNTDWSPAPEDLTTKTEFATFEANYKGFQQTVKSDISGLESQQTQMAGQINQTVERVDKINTDIANYLSKTSFEETKKVRNWDFEIIRPLDVEEYIFEFEARANKVGTISVYLNDDTGQQRTTIQYRNEFNGNLTSNAPVFNIDNGEFKTYFVRLKVLKAPNATNQIKMRVYGNLADMEITGKKAYLHKGWNSRNWQLPPEESANKSQITQLYDQLNLKVEKANVIAQINLSPEQVLIQAKRIHLSGESLIDNAVIKSAHIQDGSITNVKIQDATIDSAKIISVDADKINAQTLQSITSNTGTLNVTGWMNLLTDNNGIRGSFDYGDATDVYNPRWFDGEFSLAKRMLFFQGDIYNLNANGSKGAYSYSTGSIFGLDHFKFRSYNNRNGGNNNLRSRIDITSDKIELSNNFNTEAVRAFIRADGSSAFENVSTGIINAGVYYNTLKLNTEWRRNLGTITMTSSENGVWINDNTSVGNAQFIFGRDTAGARIWSMDLYNRTYSGNSDLIITSAGTLGRRTSARKYKADIIISESVVKNAKKVLEIKPVSWLDRAELDRGEANTRYHGFIADEFDSIGLKEVVIYNERKEVEGLAYDRISMYHNVILSEHEDRLKRLERMLIGK